MPASVSLRAWAALLALTLIAGCGADQSGSGSSNRTHMTAPDGDHEWFVDRARETGLDFVHFNGMSGQFYIPENMGPGVGLLDYDNDGDLDVYLVQGRMLEAGRTLGQATFPPTGALPPRGRLYRNDLKIEADGTRTLHFTDVTDKSGIDARGYGMGVATGDYNNDGCIDLYLTNFGSNQLYRNNCDGTFTDVSRQSGTESRGWSVSASFMDYDHDGWLDLFVGHYLDYTVETDVECLGRTGERDYCHPSAYRPQPSHLYHNNHDGTFSDVTAKAFTGVEFGPVLGVTAADFNGDGWIDLYVANDTHENQLWINQRDGTFKNTALLAGVALTVDGQAEASMGVDAGDFDNDGDEDLIMTELTSQGHNLYVNDGTGTFEDRGTPSGIGPLSVAYTGFGAAWLDFDNDGWLDILTVNGTITAIEAQRRARDPFPQRQRKQLFRNLRDGRFEDVSDRAGPVFQTEDVGRGAAFGDIDNDGDEDVVVAIDSGRTQLLINQIGSRKHWLGLRLVGEHGRDMLGARVIVTRKSGPTLWRRARADGSYGSANDPRVLVGLGDSAEAPRVRVRWPSGRVEEWSDVAIDRYTTLKEGAGR
jgi:hypothetical protein